MWSSQAKRVASVEYISANAELCMQQCIEQHKTGETSVVVAVHCTVERIHHINIVGTRHRDVWCGVVCGVQMLTCDLQSGTDLLQACPHCTMEKDVTHTISFALISTSIQNTKYKIQNTKWCSAESDTMQRGPVADSRSAKYTFGTHISPSTAT